MGKEVSAVHVYFHREELEALRKIAAANDQSVRMLVRLLVRDFLLQHHRENQSPVHFTWTITYPPGVNG